MKTANKNTGNNNEKCRLFVENFNIESEIKILLCVDEGRTLLQHVNENLPISLF